MVGVSVKDESQLKPALIAARIVRHVAEILRLTAPMLVNGVFNALDLI